MFDYPDTFITPDGKEWELLDTCHSNMRVDTLIISNFIEAYSAGAQVFDEDTFEIKNLIDSDYAIIKGGKGRSVYWYLYACGDALERFRSYPCVNDYGAEKLKTDIFLEWVFSNDDLFTIGLWDRDTVEEKIGYSVLLNIVESCAKNVLGESCCFAIDAIDLTCDDNGLPCPDVEDILISDEIYSLLINMTKAAIIQELRYINRARVKERRQGF